MQNWQKKGLIFKPKGKSYWQYGHAQLPTVDYVLGDKICRIYYAGRTREQISHVGWFWIFDIEEMRVTGQSSKPALAPGAIGCFDQHGVYPSCIVNFLGKKYLYYIGWNRGLEAPLFYASIGLAISENKGKTFERFSKAPILQRSEYDPCLVTAPHVFLENDRDWKMTYVSGIKWEEKNGQLQSFYNIKIAFSQDGIVWKRNGDVAIDFTHPEEKNIARTFVLKNNKYYQAWYSYARPPKKYRIGYAESNDGIKWARKDELVNLDVSPGKFDSDMLCYPNVITYEGKKYMFYNGNQFGKEGIALAIWHEDNT